MMWYERTISTYFGGKIIPMRCDDVIYLSHHMGVKTERGAALLQRFGITQDNIGSMYLCFEGLAPNPGINLYNPTNLLAITFDNYTDNIKSLPYVCYIGRLTSGAYLCIVLCSTDKLSLHYKQLTEDLKELGINCNRCDLVGFWRDSEPLVIRGETTPYNGLYKFPRITTKRIPQPRATAGQCGRMFGNLILDNNLQPTTTNIHKPNIGYMGISVEDWEYLNGLRTINQRTGGELLRLIQSFNLVGIDRGRKVDLQPNNKTIWQIS